MAQFIEPYRPRLPAHQKGTLTAYKAVAPMIAAIGVGNDLRQRVRRMHFDISGGSMPSDFCWFEHSPGMARFALESRNKLLPFFDAADQARCLMFRNASLASNVRQRSR